MQEKQVRPRARRDRVAATLLVAELHEQASLECAASTLVKLLVEDFRIAMQPADAGAVGGVD